MANKEQTDDVQFWTGVVLAIEDGVLKAFKVTTKYLATKNIVTNTALNANEVFEAETTEDIIVETASLAGTVIVGVYGGTVGTEVASSFGFTDKYSTVAFFVVGSTLGSEVGEKSFEAVAKNIIDGWNEAFNEDEKTDTDDGSGNIKFNNIDDKHNYFSDKGDEGLTKSDIINSASADDFGTATNQPDTKPSSPSKPSYPDTPPPGTPSTPSKPSYPDNGPPGTSPSPSKPPTPGKPSTPSKPSYPDNGPPGTSPSPSKPSYPNTGPPGAASTPTQKTWRDGPGGNYPPVLIDLDGDGDISIIAADQSGVIFDGNGDGFGSVSAWVAANDGFLAYDKDKDGIIKDHDELSFITYLEGAKTDLEGLKFFDTNNNGLLDTGDAKWEQFKIFQDSNSNGVTDEGELKTLAHYNIVSLNLTSDGKSYDLNGAHIYGETTFTKADGVTITGFDTLLEISKTGFSLHNYNDSILLMFKDADGGISRSVTYKDGGKHSLSVTDENNISTVIGGDGDDKFTLDTTKGATYSHVKDFQIGADDGTDMIAIAFGGTRTIAELNAIDSFTAAITKTGTGTLLMGDVIITLAQGAGGDEKASHTYIKGTSGDNSFTLVLENIDADDLTASHFEFI